MRFRVPLKSTHVAHTVAAAMAGEVSKPHDHLFRFVFGVRRDKTEAASLLHHPGFRFIMEWARSGRLGDVFSIRGRISSWPGSEDRWKLCESRGVRAGGIMFIVGCHLIDIIVSILGRPRHVTRFARHDGGDPPWFPDNTAAVFEYGGAMANLESAGPASVRWLPSSTTGLPGHIPPK